MGFSRQFNKVKKFFGVNSVASGPDQNRATFEARTGFMKSDLASYFQKGDSLASGDGIIPNAPSQTTIGKQEYMKTNANVAKFKALGESINTSTSKEDVESMANVLKARLGNIQNKRARPGLMQTRGQR